MPIAAIFVWVIRYLAEDLGRLRRELRYAHLTADPVKAAAAAVAERFAAAMSGWAAKVVPLRR
jgi:hypothetical protein